MAAYILVLVGFKGAEYADCNRRTRAFWWVPIFGFMGLSAWFVSHGLDFLASAESHSEDVVIHPVVISELELRDVQRACDTFQHRECNLHAIAVTLQSLRKIERYGTYTTEQAAEGMRALPPPNVPEQPKATPWWDVLSAQESWPLDAIEMAYRMKAAKAHPDTGGTVDQMAALNAAIEEARKAKR